ncbi:MAG: phosphoribosylanthranilate isomerase [Firmicutes bacterium]|nr:phosphoribosylanthranilate isomerase [Bacillota bacterium]
MAPEVKICGVKDVDTALAIYEAGADYIGLVLAKSPRQVSLGQAREITMALPRVRFVAVVRNMDRDTLDKTLNRAPFWAVQYHGEANFDWIRVVHEYGLKAIATQINPAADIILMDGPEPGKGQTWEWQRPNCPQPIWIAGGLTPNNVSNVIRSLRPEGVDVSSGVETNGVKDLVKVRQFIKEAKQWQR